jgi:hypothetical protein
MSELVKKTYCKDCKYKKRYDYYGYGEEDFCFYPYPYQMKMSEKMSRVMNNKDKNLCKFYQRKWWKFWLRK